MSFAFVGRASIGISATLAMTWLVVSPALATDKGPISVRAGAPTVVMSYATYNPNTCGHAALPAARIVQPPAHGTALVGKGAHAIDAGRCEGKKVLSRTVVYRSAPGYRGTDRIVVDVEGERFINGVGTWGDQVNIDIIAK